MSSISIRPNAAGTGMIARILIADDRLSHRELMRYTLETSGYEVVEAESCEQAIEQAPIFAPHIVILDVNMPRMGGCAAARVLRGIPAFKNTPIVALTAATSDQFADAVEQAGFSKYLIKPVGPAQLRQCIAALL